ncbi:MAG: riboflavin transporter, partial [Erysipelotrichaceae bacterium]|nr:riboflavin transporter [Erysipelotrichaceae bacterium]
GLVANQLKLKEQYERRDIINITTVSAFLALAFNVIADPVVGYFYRKYLLGIPQDAAKIIATWVAGTTAINAIICVFVSVILYLALYKSFLPRIPE